MSQEILIMTRCGGEILEDYVGKAKKEIGLIIT